MGQELLNVITSSTAHALIHSQCAQSINTKARGCHGVDVLRPVSSPTMYLLEEKVMRRLRLGVLDGWIA